MSLGLDHMPASLFYPFFKLSCWSMTNRFIAGHTIPQALGNVYKLWEKNIDSTLDVLGESVATMADALGNISQYDAVLAAAVKRFKGLEGFHPNFSVKLTGLYPEAGLIRENQGGIEDNFRQALDLAIRYLAFMRLDTEYFKELKLTNDVYRTVASEERYASYPGHGIVQQLYLKSAEDIAKEWIEFAKWRFERFNTASSFRLVKGAYVETEAKRALAEELGIDRSLLEFQFLFGMDDLVSGIQARGYKVREYLP